MNIKDDYFNNYNNIIVIDFDDTISMANTYDNVDLYAKALPNKDVINIMKKLYNKGYKFIIYTARGWISCNEDIVQADKKYRNQIENWLKKYSVPYEKLIFGKPFGIYYVDDKALRPDEFVKMFR